MAGYIGIHTILLRLDGGYEAVVIDNFSRSGPDSLNALETISGKKVPFYCLDINDFNGLNALMQKYQFHAVLHFAGLKSPIESITYPYDYWQSNYCGSITLFRAMANNGVFRLVFSSSAAVYGHVLPSPLKESYRELSPDTPYAYSKLFVEQSLSMLSSLEEKWQVICLRYFNPIGAHPSGTIGERSTSENRNLLQSIARVIRGFDSELEVYGLDFDTHDGSAM